MKTFVVCIASAMLAFAPTAVAHADPDPYIPDPHHDYCQGSGPSSLTLGYCDGLPYQDGSYWHYVLPWVTITEPRPGMVGPGIQCVAKRTGLLLQLAPPGGCGNTPTPTIKPPNPLGGLPST